MIRKLFRRGLRLGAVVGAILFLIQVFLRNPAPKPSDTSTARPSPGPGPRPEPVAKAAPPAATGNGAKAATSAPAKAKPAASKKPAAAKAAATTTSTTAEVPTWVEPEGGECPPTHPVKVKLASGIYHVPGGLAYDRTAPDRCYRDAAAAEADGFRPSKR